MPFGRKRVDGYGTGRPRKLASLQLVRDAKASRVEYANEPAATTSSSTMVPARMACSASKRPSTAPVDPSQRLTATEWKFGYADLLEEIGVPRFLVVDETDADGDVSTVLVRCAVLPSLVANLPCTLLGSVHSPPQLSTAPSAWFDWCSVPKKNKGVPLDCYNRISGVLWTNDKFQVSTNKLTFIDLELRLRDKNTTYGRILGKNEVSKGQQAARRLQEYAVLIEKRTDIGREFTTWLKECHERCDKQVKFSHYSGTISRPELVKHRQSPWSVYGQIEWDGKVFKKGTMVRIVKTVPITYGTIRHFLLYGNHDGDVFATGGDITVTQEPRSLYNEVKTFPLSKLDRTASHTLIMKYIDEEVSKLPDKLVVTWPEGDEVQHGEKRPAGKTIGAIKVEIANRKGELINKLPGAAGGTSRKLLVELKVIWHSCNGDEVIVQHISQHGRTWPYWFRKMENIKNLGPHTILLQAVLNESGASTFAGKDLPSSAVRFTVIEAEPEKFSVGLLEGPFRVGVAFQIPLEFQDEFGHTTKPTSTLTPTLHASDLELTYGNAVLEGSHLIIKDIIATGAAPSSTGMNVQLVVTIPGLLADSQTLKIRLLPGVPHSLVVTPDTEVTVENGNVPSFEVEVRDCAGNLTTQPRLQVMCKFGGAPGLPTYTVDCSSEGRGVLSGAPLLLKKMVGEQILTASIEIPGFKAAGAVERSVKVLPSSEAASISMTYRKDDKTDVSIKNRQDISVVAGELLRGLKFQIMDEAGRMKPCDKTLASKMKVNWTPKLSKDLLTTGSLPDVRAPSTLQDSKYCHISLTDGSGIEFSFNIKPVPGEPAQLRCKCSGSNQVRLGETFTSDIQVSVRDSTGNEIKKFEKGVLKDLSVTGDGLVVKETVRMLGQKSGFNIEGVRFESGQLGPRELKISWRNLTDYVRLEMVAGPPAALQLLGWDTQQPVVVYNGNLLLQPLLVQLVDEVGNPTAEANVRVQLTRDPGVKLVPSPVPTKTDQNGLASFGIPAISGKKGIYEIQAKAFIGRTTLQGPKLLISIQADFLKPVSLTVEYDKNVVYKAGEPLPDFSVRVISEDETVMTSAKASHLSMRLWPVSGRSDTSSAKTTTLAPDPRKKGASEGKFIFTNRKVPEKAGTYHIMFVYNDHKYEVDSNEIAIKVHPVTPERLVPVEMPGTPTVSNARSVTSRTLIRSLQLQLRDKFDNPCSSEVNGKVNLEIVSSSQQVAAVIEKPEFVGHTKQLMQTLTKGQVTLQNVVLEENTTGRDGQEYMLRCSVDSATLQRLGSQSLIYDIPFLFYNDANCPDVTITSVGREKQLKTLTTAKDNRNHVN
ncbi:Structural maintenance of chromosomes flexible hinge domain-containing protein 1 [Lamellibrachia satsuma]|nr:Structural maintenance of chromosomes flexible hinge domain-containing protein 1 [Lamellibrachia satsuma]